MGAEPDNAREGRKPARGRRWLLVAAILVALYALLGFLVAPATLRHPLERQASALLGREVTLDRLRLNPFALSVTADGLHIKDKDGTPLLRWERLYLDFAALRSLWRREYCFGQIHLVGAAGRLAVLPGGALNIDDIVERVTAPAPGAPQEPGPPPVINVGRLRIEDASLGFVDRSTPATFTTTLGPLRIDLRDFTTKRGEGNEYTFRGSTEAGESFSWNGTFSLDPLGSDGSFTLENVTLAKYHPYYGGVVPFDIKDGQGDIRSGYRFAWGASNHVLALKGAAATVRNLKLSEHEKEEIAVDAPIAEASEGDLDLMTGALTLGRFSARDGHIQMRKTKEGKVNLLEMLLPFFEETPAPGAGESGAPAPAPAPAGGAAPDARMLIGDLTFANYTLDAEDLSPPRPVRVRLDQINLNLKGVDNVRGTTAKSNLDLRWNGAGTLHADGDISLVGLDGLLNVKIDGLDVTPVDPYVEPALDLRVTHGLFSAAGKFSANLLDPDHIKVAYQGDVAMDGFAAVDGPHRADFMSWKSVRIGKIDYVYETNRMRIGTLAVDGAKLIAAYAPDGRLNVFDVLRMTPPPPATEEETQPATGAPDATGATTAAADTPAGDTPATDAPPAAAPAAAPASAAAPAKPAAASPATDLGDIRIAQATLRGTEMRFVDRTMNPPVTFALTRIEGTLAGLSSRPGARADVRLSARVDDTAPVTLSGQLDPLGTDVYSDLALAAKGIDLSPISPYCGRYLGYGLDRGRLDLAMQYHLEDRSLKGANLFTANPFTLGAKTESPDATHLPVRLGLALLRDRNGVIEMDVPVEGSLDDPKFRLGRLILRAVVNVFTKLVTSPFKLMARAFAGKEDLDLSIIDFEPGSAAITADARSRVDAVGRGLVERPGLTLSIAGAADPTFDTEPIRQTKLTALLQAEKWANLGRRDREATPAESLAIDPGERPKLLKAAWKKGREAHPDPPDTPKPETPEEYEARILSWLTVGPEDLSALAVARAEAVQGAIVGAGVEATRVTLRQEQSAPATRVTLELQ